MMLRICYCGFIALLECECFLVSWLINRYVHLNLVSPIHCMVYLGYIFSWLPGQRTRFSNPNYLILIMFILNHFLEVQLLFCMELLELIALRSFILPWWKLPNRYVTWCFRGSYYAVESRGVCRSLQTVKSNEIKPLQNKPYILLFLRLARRYGFFISYISYNKIYETHLQT